MIFVGQEILEGFGCVVLAQSFKWLQSNRDWSQVHTGGSGKERKGTEQLGWLGIFM